MATQRRPAPHGGQDVEPRYAPTPVTTDNHEDAVEQPQHEQWEQRQSFVEHILAIVFVQLLFTNAVYHLSCNSAALRASLDQDVAELGIAMYAYLGIIFSSTVRRRSPDNVTALFLATIGFGIFMGNTSAMMDVKADWDTSTVNYTAAVITAGAGVACFLFALTSPLDLTPWAFVLGCVTVAFVCTECVIFSQGLEHRGYPDVFLLYFISPRSTVVAAVLATRISIAFVSDVQALLGSGPFARARRRPLDRDDWVYGALALYIDSILLFLAIHALALKYEYYKLLSSTSGSGG